MALTPSTLCPLSLEYVLSLTGQPVVGAQLFVYAAGTLTPAVAFADAELTAPLQQPVKTTGSGRFPAVYVGQGYFHYRVLDPNGVVLDDLDGIQGAVVTSVTNNVTNNGLAAPTGSLVHFYGLEVPSGWLRANGRTISNAIGGGTELGDPSTQALFVALWDADPNLAVSGGRGNTAVSDFNAGKQIALPDLRRQVLVGIDGMGNGVLNGPAGALNTLGATVGEEDHLLAITEMPNHSHIMSCDIEGGHIHAAACDIQGLHGHGAQSDVQGDHTHSAGSDVQGGHVHPASVDAQGVHQHQATMDSQGDHYHSYENTTYNLDGPVNSNYSSFMRSTEVDQNQTTNTTGAHVHNITVVAAGSHIHNVTINDSGEHSHNITVQNNGSHSHNITVVAAGQHQHNITTADAGEHTHVVTAQPVGGSGAHNNVQPSMPVTILIKL